MTKTLLLSREVMLKGLSSCYACKIAHRQRVQILVFELFVCEFSTFQIAISEIAKIDRIGPKCSLGFSQDMNENL